MSVVNLINLPNSLIEKYSIIDYEYIEEDVIIKQDLI